VLETAERTSGYGDSSSSTAALGSRFGSSKSSVAMSYVCPTECVSCLYVPDPRGEEIE
jgi:hypothetical protein